MNTAIAKGRSYYIQTSEQAVFKVAKQNIPVTVVKETEFGRMLCLLRDGEKVTCRKNALVNK